MLRLLFSTGLSREARRTPGWLARLLRYIADSPTAAGPVSNYAVRPLPRLLELTGTVFPQLAYRPCRRSDGCDILLSLHRAEGFGLIMAEMM